MLLIARKISDLDVPELWSIYANDHGMNISGSAGQGECKREFYLFLTDFFCNLHGSYFILIEDSAYVSAVRAQKFEDGILISGLQTKREQRNKGYAKCLLKCVCDEIRRGGDVPIYSHVSEKNSVSLAVHRSCDFHVLKESAHMLDGSVRSDTWTLVYL